MNKTFSLFLTLLLLETSLSCFDGLLVTCPLLCCSERFVDLVSFRDLLLTSLIGNAFDACNRVWYFYIVG